MRDADSIAGYSYSDFDAKSSHDYIFPVITAELELIRSDMSGREARVLELGCGNGSLAASMTELVWGVSCVAPSAEGGAQEQAAAPTLKLALGSVREDLSDKYEKFIAVASLEAVEYVYALRGYAKPFYGLLEPAGLAIISTPFYGYWKDLAMAVTGKLDAHFRALWGHCHIKFWSEKTLTELLVEIGFEPPYYRRVGRIPILAAFKIAITRKAVG